MSDESVIAIFEWEENIPCCPYCDGTWETRRSYQSIPRLLQVIEFPVLIVKEIDLFTKEVDIISSTHQFQTKSWKLVDAQYAYGGDRKYMALYRQED